MFLSSSLNSHIWKSISKTEPCRAGSDTGAIVLDSGQLGRYQQMQLLEGKKKKTMAKRKPISLAVIKKYFKMTTSNWEQLPVAN